MQVIWLMRSPSLCGARIVLHHAGRDVHLAASLSEAWPRVNRSDGWRVVTRFTDC